MRQMVQAAEDENADVLIDMLHDDFKASQAIDKSAASAIIRGYFSRPQVNNNHIDSMEITVDSDDKGEVLLGVTTTLDPKSPYAMTVPVVRSTWRFDFLRDDDGVFRAVDLEMIKLHDGQPVNVWRGM